MLRKETTRKIFEQQLRDKILSMYKDDYRRRIREYILEVSEKLNGVQKEENDTTSK